MNTDLETEIERRLVEAKAAEDKAKAERKAADDELRWIRKNRVQISSDAFDLLHGDADDNVVEQMDRAWSEAMRAMREKQRKQTEAARSAVADGMTAGQESASDDDSDSVLSDVHREQDHAESGGPLVDG